MSFTPNFNISASLIPLSGSGTALTMRPLDATVNVLDFAKDGTSSYSVSATPNEPVSKVELVLNTNGSVTSTRVEGLVPYALLGDGKNANNETTYRAWQPVAGSSGNVTITGIDSGGHRSQPFVFQWAAQSGVVSTNYTVDPGDASHPANLAGHTSKGYFAATLGPGYYYLDAKQPVDVNDLHINGAPRLHDPNYVLPDGTVGADVPQTIVKLRYTKRDSHPFAFATTPRAHGFQINDVLFQWDYSDDQVKNSGSEGAYVIDDLGTGTTLNHVWSTQMGMHQIEGSHDYTENGCVVTQSYYNGGYSGTNMNYDATLRDCIYGPARFGHSQRWHLTTRLRLLGTHIAGGMNQSFDALKLVEGQDALLDGCIITGTRAKFGPLYETSNMDHRLDGLLVRNSQLLTYVVLERGASHMVFDNDYINGGREDGPFGNRPRVQAGFVNSTIRNALIGEDLSGVGYLNCKDKYGHSLPNRGVIPWKDWMPR